MFSPEPVPVLVADAAAAPELAFEAGGTPAIESPAATGKTVLRP